MGGIGLVRVLCLVMATSLLAVPLPAQQQPLEDAEAARELQLEEHQRILGVLPNFNTVSMQSASTLTAKQKFELATRSALDPVTFAIAGLNSAWSQERNSFAGYGQGMQGYGKRYGAAYADTFTSTMLGNAFLPILFHQDPRYFRKGTGTVSGRFWYAISTTVRAKDDSGKWVPNYSNILGNFAAGGLSNLYYPSSDRGAGLTMERAALVTAEGSLGALFVEFWPDFVAHHRRKHS